MRTRASRTLRFFIAPVAAALLVYAPACSDTDSHGAGAPDAIYEGGTNDEALDAILGTAPKTDAARAPVIASPAAGAKLPAATPATFTWKASATASLLPAPAHGTRRGLWSSPARPLPSLWPLGGERLAHAHGDPVNGRAYVLLLSAGGGGGAIVRVFTTKTSYTPDASRWQSLVSAKSITATVLSASYDNNNLVADSGPFASAAVSFTIE